MNRLSRVSFVVGVILTGCLLSLGGCGSSSGGGSNPTPKPTSTPIPAQACAGQGLIGIDPVNNVGYVPISATDAGGNAQIAVVDLTPNVANPVLKTLSLTGASVPEALTYDSNNKVILAEAATSSGSVDLFVIDTTTQSVVGTPITLTGLDTGRGGILEDAKHNRAFIAGLYTIGILNTSQSPPAWDSGSVVAITCTDSLALNVATGVLFVTCDGTNQIIDTTKTPLTPVSFQGGFGTSDGVAFDPSTNIMILGQEFVDATTAFNFATLDTSSSPATADNVNVPGLGESGIVGEGPGQAVINCNTHQGVVADEGGNNFRLIQLPKKAVKGALNNNGQPGTSTTADAASAYSIAAAITPNDPAGGAITIQGDPNSASVDPNHNYFYVIGNGASGQFLVRADLSKPVFGGSPTGGPDGKTYWTPQEQAIPLP